MSDHYMILTMYVEYNSYIHSALKYRWIVCPDLRLIVDWLGPADAISATT